MDDTVTKLSAYATVESVEERFETFNYRKVGDGSEHDKRSLGWYVRCAGSSALYVGSIKPPAAFKRGARVKLSVEIAPYLTGDFEGVHSSRSPDPLAPLAAALSVPDDIPNTAGAVLDASRRLRALVDEQQASNSDD